jgi:hypothetical protein
VFDQSWGGEYLLKLVLGDRYDAPLFIKENRSGTCRSLIESKNGARHGFAFYNFEKPV